MSWIFYVLSPTLLHLVISETITVLAGNKLDSAACTALSAFLVLPVAIWMYQRDARLNRNSVYEGATVMRSLAIAIICLIGGGLLNVIWSRLMEILRISSFFSNETQEALLTSGLMTQLLGPGLLVPIAEELIFRGLTYSRMKTRLNTRQAIFFSALLFALYHGNPIQMIYAFPMALLLAFFYERSGSLMVPILIHMGANLAAIFAA